MFLPPEPFSGEIGNCIVFLLHCSLVFDQQPLSYPSERAKVAYMIIKRQGQWATAVWEQNCPILFSFSSFSSNIGFYPLQIQEASKCLFSLVQGSQACFSIEFHNAAAESGWVGEGGTKRDLSGVYLRLLKIS